MESNQELIISCEKKAKEWLSSSFNEETKKEVQAMLDNADKTELIDSFYKDLEFGTGGLRGIMGAGSNRMNIYTVGMATQGFANYLKKSFANKETISVVVGHDCRNNSRLFAETVAAIFSANGIKVYLFDDLRPTPEVSFAIRELKCQGGVNLTASHNPKEYNGYKAYWDDGAQVLAPHDKGIIDEVEKVKIEDVQFGANNDLIQIIGKEIDDLYLDRIKTLSIDPAVIERHKDLKIVYTPLHGAGRTLIPESLKRWGFEKVYTVKEQMVKDGNFPTVVSPNPENGEALTLALRDAKEIDADIVMASDPDADRVGMACKNDKGEWVLINGNQTCLIFLYYIITNRIKTGKMQPNDFIVKTIVTTELIKKIADKNNVEMIDFVRDKDAVSAMCLLAEICAYAKDQGKTLYDLLMEIYLEYGFSYEFTVNVVRPGKTGADEIKQMMENFRNNPPKQLGDSPIIITKDFLKLEQRDANGNVTKLEMPDTSNVLQWFCENGDKVSVRPSGTEPKIKFYFEVKGEMKCADCYERCVKEALEKIEEFKKELSLD